MDHRGFDGFTVVNVEFFGISNVCNVSLVSSADADEYNSRTGREISLCYFVVNKSRHNFNNSNTHTQRNLNQMKKLTNDGTFCNIG